jgi:hypothetical protein
MNLALNREYPDPDEAKLIEEMVKVAVERMKPQQGRIRRGQHAKATGCVRGVFRIRDDVPVDLRHGVFHRPGQSFQAIVRFSNSSETIAPDGNVDARGMAIKLLDVDGTPAIPGTSNRCQDFLTVNLPVFPFATPAEYLKFFDIRAAPLVGDPPAAAWFALFHPRHLTSVVKIISETVASPLVTYWSGSPYWPRTTGNNRRTRCEILAGATFRREGAADPSKEQARRLPGPSPGTVPENTGSGLRIPCSAPDRSRGDACRGRVSRVG